LDCRDAKDNVYLALARSARAIVIMSGDADLLVLDPWPGIRVMTPAGFLAASQPDAALSSSLPRRHQ